MKKWFAGVLCALFVLLNLNALATPGDIGRLYTFTPGPGSPVRSAHVNAEFDQLVTTANSQNARVYAIEEQTKTLNGNKTFTGSTTFSGAVTFSAIPSGVIPSGIVTPYLGSSAPTGWVLMAGKTLGNASSGGTERANADTATLYTLVWTNCADAQCPVSSGRGASAAADYAANKTITLPDLRGRVVIGLDNLGGSAASRITSSSTNGANSTTLGAAGGAQTHTLTESEMPSHTHTVSAGPGGGGMTTDPGGTNINVTTRTTSSAGGDQPHSNTQPWLALGYIIKL